MLNYGGGKLYYVSVVMMIVTVNTSNLERIHARFCAWRHCPIGALKSGITSLRREGRNAQNG